MVCEIKMTFSCKIDKKLPSNISSKRKLTAKTVASGFQGSFAALHFNISKINNILPKLWFTFEIIYYLFVYLLKI